MSYGEGYELSSCPNCGSNLYDPHSGCFNCRFRPLARTTYIHSHRALRRNLKPKSLIVLALLDPRADTEERSARLARQLPSPHNCEYEKWRAETIERISAITETNLVPDQRKKIESSLPHLYRLLLHAPDDPRLLNKFFGYCRHLTAVAAQRSRDIVRTKSKSRGRKKRTHLPGSAATFERRIVRFAFKALGASDGAPPVRLIKDLLQVGDIIAYGTFSHDLRGSEARTRVNHEFFGRAQWSDTWRATKRGTTERTLKRGSITYSLVINDTTKAAYVLRHQKT